MDNSVWLLRNYILWIRLYIFSQWRCVARLLAYMCILGDLAIHISSLCMDNYINTSNLIWYDYNSVVQRRNCTSNISNTRNTILITNDRNSITPRSNTPLLTPAVNLLSQFLSLVVYELHHGLNLLAIRLIISSHMSILPIRGLRSKASIVDRDHQVHHRGQLVRKPLLV